MFLCLYLDKLLTCSMLAKTAWSVQIRNFFCSVFGDFKQFKRIPDKHHSRYFGICSVKFKQQVSSCSYCIYCDVQAISAHWYSFQEISVQSQQLKQFWNGIGHYPSVFNIDTELGANIYLFKVNSRNTRKRREKCSKLTIKTENNKNVTDVVLLFSLLTFYIFHTFLHIFLMFVLVNLNK